jgi:hypothetical protein
VTSSNPDFAISIAAVFWKEQRRSVVMPERTPLGHDAICAEKEPVVISGESTLERKIGPIPPSGLGPDGKLRVMTEEEHRQYIESALRRIDAIEQIPDDPNDPPEEEWMRAIDELRPHRPVFKG